MKNFFKSGNMYFFNLNNKVMHGTLQYCDECGKPCHSNSITVIQAPTKKVSAFYNSDMDNSGGIYYNKKTDLCLCDTCDSNNQ